MDDSEQDRCNKIDVKLNLGDYLVTAVLLNGPETEQWWQDIGDLLYGRPGWYCEVIRVDQGIEMIWSFGAMGSSLFVVSTLRAPAYHLYDCADDRELEFADIEELRIWLDENEHRHAEYPVQLRSMAEALDWAPLRSFPFSVDVTFDGGFWIATFPQLPLTYSSGPTLSEAVSSAREAIVGAFGAPQKVARELTLQLHLDSAAAAAI